MPLDASGPDVDGGRPFGRQMRTRRASLGIFVGDLGVGAVIRPVVPDIGREIGKVRHGRR